MSKRWIINLERYNISKRRYLELINFCMQYPEWRAELEYTQDALKSPTMSGMPRSGEMSDTTSNLAVKRIDLQIKCELIEQLAIKCCPDAYRELIKNVSEECYSYESMENKLMHTGDIMPISKYEFYGCRKLFFFLLDQARG